MSEEKYPLEQDKPQEECGIFGIYGKGEDVARLTYFGLFALQHRGQESAGIAVADSQDIAVHKRMGLVNQVFDETVLRELRGYIAIGHTRYSTTGSSVLCNAQPLLASSTIGPIAVAHNGNLLNTLELRQDLEKRGVVFETTSDSEIIAHYLAYYADRGLEKVIPQMMKDLRGAYSLVVLTRKHLYAIRDPYGLRPLCIGRMPSGAIVFSSESCALHVIGAEYLREVEPGEVVIASEKGMKSFLAASSPRRALCIFEFIYLARPDSHLFGRSIHLARQRMGEELAREQPVPGAHLVIPVPDTGIPAAIGFARASGIPFGEGLIKSRYIQRTFIQPDQAMREMGARMKFTPLKEQLAGKRVIVVDDSIVRGTTTRQIVQMLFDAGCTEVHMRITSPPIRYPCFYGIDMAHQEELIASRLTEEEVCRHIGATSLGYLSLAGLIRAIGVPENLFCTACLTSCYPIEIPPDVKLSKWALEEEKEKTEVKVSV